MLFQEQPMVFIVSINHPITTVQLEVEITVVFSYYNCNMSTIVITNASVSRYELNL